ncbi:MAG: DUF2784 domain-containing protein [Nitrospirae bacterium]|nr:DUF2784 domain-containing protein [Nitrospirota bacterium]
MPYKLLADLTAFIHLAFVVFVILGGLLLIRWNRFAWLHIPAALWGALIEFKGWYCPLTGLELFLLEKAGASGYSRGFVAHYILPVVYPGEMTRELQIGLGLFVVFLNIIIYGFVIYRYRIRR